MLSLLWSGNPLDIRTITAVNTSPKRPDTAALERLPDMIAPAVAWRRALAVMLHEHHREPDNPDAPARCAGTASLAGQPIAAETPPREYPGLSAPGRNARQPNAAASSQAVGHRRIAAVHLYWRPHVVRVNRAAGIVAPSPFHVPAVPFAAAAIPPHCPIPPPATPRGVFVRGLRLRRRSRPQNAVPYSSIKTLTSESPD